MLEILSILSFLALVAYLLVTVVELRFKLHATILLGEMQQATSRIECVDYGSTSQSSVAALTALRKTHEKAQMLKESQAQLTYRLLTFVLGVPRK